MIAARVTARAPSLLRVTSQSHSIADLAPSLEMKTFFTVIRKSRNCLKCSVSPRIKTVCLLLMPASIVTGSQMVRY